MTREELKEAVSKLMLMHPPLEEIERLIDKSIQSGALNYDLEPADSFRTAKIIYSAVLMTMAIQWRPQVRKNLRDTNNLIKFIL
jgi:hypothetical protein